MAKLKITSLEENPRFLEQVKKYFSENIAEAYGDQSQALSKITQDRDRKCELIFAGDSLYGVAVYKLRLQNEYSHLGLSDSLEVKTFFISATGLKLRGICALLLLKKVAEYAKKICAQSISGTVAVENTKSRKFFDRMNFKVVNYLSTNTCQKKEVLVASESPRKLLECIKEFCDFPSLLKSAREVVEEKSSAKLGKIKLGIYEH